MRQKSLKLENHRLLQKIKQEVHKKAKKKKGIIKGENTKILKNIVKQNIEKNIMNNAEAIMNDEKFDYQDAMAISIQQDVRNQYNRKKILEHMS